MFTLTLGLTRDLLGADVNIQLFIYLCFMETILWSIRIDIFRIIIRDTTYIRRHRRF